MFFFLKNSYAHTLSNCHQFEANTIHIFALSDVCPKCVIRKSVFLIAFHFIYFFRCFKSINFAHNTYQHFIRALPLKPFQRCYLNLSTRIQCVRLLWFNICWHFCRLAHEIGNVDTGYRHCCWLAATAVIIAVFIAITIVAVNRIGSILHVQ